MERGATGRFVLGARLGGEQVRAFVPAPLPPRPELQLGAQLREALDASLLALGRLDSLSTLLPDTSLFLYTYVRKEAVLSSQIEGTQSSLSDLLFFELDEAPGVPFDDVQEVSSYVRALDHGLARLREGFPLSGRLLREVHGELMARGRGSEKAPGEFRRSQNWIGGSRPGNAHFVPPPPEEVPGCMAALESFLHDEKERTSPLVKAALAHVQFETIHPFLDGNGRLGRLLITLLLVSEGVLQEPLLYLSLFLKLRRQDYYALLQRVRDQGDWEEWLEFFATGVQETAASAVDAARRLSQLFARDRERIQALGRTAGSGLRVHDVLQRHPVQTVRAVAAATELSVPTVNSVMTKLEAAGIVREVTGKQRDRIFVYGEYLDILEEGPPSVTE